MADQNPIPPSGDVPPKPAEASKVQPKKETVRINLPPKPTASPTIKIPAPAAVAAATPASAAPVAASAAPSAPSAAPRPTAAPSAPSRPAPASRPVRAAAGVGMIDNVLGIVAALVGLAVVVRLFLMVGP